MNPLQDLIRRRMAERQWTYADIARRGKLPRSTVHHLANNAHPSRPPHPQTVTRLAIGLDLPPEQVRAAAAEATGDGSAAGHHHGAAARGSRDPELSQLFADLGRLGPADLRRVAAYVCELLASAQGDPTVPGSVTADVGASVTPAQLDCHRDFHGASRPSPHPSHII